MKFIALASVCVGSMLAAAQLSKEVKYNLQGTLGYVVRVHHTVRTTNGAVQACAAMRHEIKNSVLKDLPYYDQAQSLIKMVHYNGECFTARQKAIAATKARYATQEIGMKSIKAAWDSYTQLAANLMAHVIEQQSTIICCRNFKNITSLAEHNASLNPWSADALKFKAALLAHFYIEQQRFDATHLPF